LCFNHPPSAAYTLTIASNIAPFLPSTARAEIEVLTSCATQSLVIPYLMLTDQFVLTPFGMIESSGQCAQKLSYFTS